MILYMHGFASSGQGAKARLFREYCKEKDIKFIAPSLSYIPELAILTLQELIESYDEKITLIGSSLGGYYALYLAKKYSLKVVLINPSIYPYETLKKVEHYPTNFYDGTTFEWNEHHIESLKVYEVNDLNEVKGLLLLQKGDETLDYKEALNKLPNAEIILEEDGNHSFENIQRHFDRITAFAGSY